MWRKVCKRITNYARPTWKSSILDLSQKFWTSSAKPSLPKIRQELMSSPINCSLISTRTATVSSTRKRLRLSPLSSKPMPKKVKKLSRKTLTTTKTDRFSSTNGPSSGKKSQALMKKLKSKCIKLLLHQLQRHLLPLLPLLLQLKKNDQRFIERESNFWKSVFCIFR